MSSKKAKPAQKRKKNELISLHCPTHNLKHLPDLIESVIKQNHCNWELLIGLNAPKYKIEMQKIIRKYKTNKKIKFFIFKKKRVERIIRQFLLEKTKAPYLIPLAADDLLDHNLIKEFNLKIKNNTNFSILHAGMRIFSDITSVEVLPHQRQIINDLTIDFLNCHPPFLINTNLLRKTGGWKKTRNYPGEYIELFLDLEKEAPIICIDKILYYKRLLSYNSPEKNNIFYAKLKKTVTQQIKQRKLKIAITYLENGYLDDTTQYYELYGETAESFFSARSQFKTIVPLRVFEKKDNTIPLKKAISLLPANIDLNKFFLYPSNLQKNLIWKPNVREILLEEKTNQFTKRNIFDLLPITQMPEAKASLFEPVDIILPVYNNLALTRRCIKSIFKQTGSLFDLIIVDDKSTESRLHRYYRLLRRFKNITIVFNEHNCGYATSCNIGLTRSKSRYAVIMNNDVLLAKNWLFKMLQGFLCAPTIGAIAPATFNKNFLSNEERPLEEITDYIDKRSMELENTHPTYIKSAYLFGHCLLLNRKALEFTGGLNPLFGNPSYYDDLDLSFRLRNNGYTLLLAKNVEIYHAGQMSNRIHYPDLMKYLWRNFMIFSEIWKNHNYFKHPLPGLKPESKSRPEPPRSPKGTPIEIYPKQKIKLGIFTIEKYANISHLITDQDNYNYLKEYFEVITFPEKKATTSIMDFFNYLLAEKIFFVFLNTTTDPWPLFKYRNDHQLPIGFIFWPYIFEPWKDRYYRLAKQAKSPDVFLCFSQFLKSSFQQISTNFSLLELPASIDISSFKCASLNINKLVLVYCGRTVPQKNLHVLLSLLGSSKSIIDFKLNIICPLENLNSKESRYLDSLKKLIARLELQKNVVFHGDYANDRNKRNEILGTSNVLIFLSTDPGETFGRCITEGMAAGCAVITTNWQAVNELVIDGENGFKIDLINGLPNTKQLLSALLILSDPTTRQTIQKINLRKAAIYDYRRQLPKLVNCLSNKLPPYIT